MFRRRSRSEPVEPDELDDDQATADDDAGDATEAQVAGPWDVDDLDDDGIDRVDLGSLRVAPTEGTELRLQVDEQTGEVQSAMLAGDEHTRQLGIAGEHREVVTGTIGFG